MLRRGRHFAKKASVATRRARLMMFLLNARTPLADEQLAHQFDLPVKTVREVRGRAHG
jgi:hypothetical protein